MRGVSGYFQPLALTALHVRTGCNQRVFLTPLRASRRNAGQREAGCTSWVAGVWVPGGRGPGASETLANDEVWVCVPASPTHFVSFSSALYWWGQGRPHSTGRTAVPKGDVTYLRSHSQGPGLTPELAV